MAIVHCCSQICGLYLAINQSSGAVGLLSIMLYLSLEFEFLCTFQLIHCSFNLTYRFFPRHSMQKIEVVCVIIVFQGTQIARKRPICCSSLFMVENIWIYLERSYTNSVLLYLVDLYHDFQVYLIVIFLCFFFVSNLLCTTLPCEHHCPLHIIIIMVVAYVQIFVCFSLGLNLGFY